MGEGQQQGSSQAHQAISAMQQPMQSLQEQVCDAEIPNSIQLN